MNKQLAEYINQRITVSTTELELILSFFKPLKAKKNELLITQGQTSQHMFFVLEGCLRIFYINEEGQEATRYLGFENSLTTALLSFISEKPSFEYIQALEHTDLLYITQNDFKQLLEVVPAWEQFYRRYLEYAYVLNTKKLMSFVTMDAKELYKQLLEEHPLVVKRLSSKIVASYLNISQETLSRLKSKL